ncbi:MAG: hypothetical protein D6806_04015 [Deltaproteobacteria bacterium]|nr:MAG: hypothetical protein D6806_04015 [Deltaproteobacteria bacterium]
MKPVSVAVLLVASLCSGCAHVGGFDYRRYYEHEPLMIVVLPAINSTTEAEASRLFSSTIYYQLARRGYYVTPPELVSEVLAHEGVTDGAELLDVDPGKFHRYFGADAVLFVRIYKWDTTYVVVSSSVTVGLEYVLVDARSGQILWKDRAERTISSSSGGSGIGALIGAMVSAAVTAAAVDYVPLARQANQEAFARLPVGRYHHEYEKIKARLLED